MSTGPAVAPAYPEPPWVYTNASIINVVARVQHPEGLGDFVAEGLEPRAGSDTVVFFFLDVPGIPEFGPDYHSSECGMIVPAQTPGGQQGGHFSFMLVDNDGALAAGREIWGYPKKLAEVRMRRTADDRIAASARHLPQRGRSAGDVMHLEARLDGSADHLAESVAGLQPRLLARPVRSPEGRVVDRTLMTVRNEILRVHERLTGSATVELGESQEESLHRLGRLDVLGAVYTRCDFTVDYGEAIIG